VLNALFGAVCLGFAVWWMVPSAGQVRMRRLEGTDDTSGFDIRTWFLARTQRSGAMNPERRLVHALRALAAELSAGSTPADALERAAGDPSLWPHALAAARFGESIPQGLQRDATATPAVAAQLRQLSASWHVGAAHGAGLVTSIERLALSVQAQFELRSVLNSELAAPRATMRMLSALPLVGVAMGYLLGADPIAWFLGSSIGGLFVAAAVALTIAGVVWTRRIVQRVDRAMSRG